MREMQENCIFFFRNVSLGGCHYFFFCMKALKISVLVKKDPARQMSFYLSSFSSRDGVHRFYPWISEAWGLICLLFRWVDYFDVIDHWHFPQGRPYIVHAFHGGQAKGNVIKVLTPSRWWSGVWLLGAGHMVRWHFSMADPQYVSVGECDAKTGLHFHAPCMHAKIGSSHPVRGILQQWYIFL